jgi:hydroxymethylpyrimidine/phosphomethylpyrimidine kinase
MKRARRKTAVSIAGSDSGGGAGIQADLLTFAAHGLHGATVVVAGTAQNTRGVVAVEAFSPGFIAAQIDAVFSDLSPAAVKVGMLFGAGQARAVATGLRRHGAANVVLDPVMSSTAGVALLSREGLRALAEDLLPLCDLVTPNLPEASVLAGFAVETSDEARHAARKISSLGPRAVLVKGGHGKGARVVDVLWTGKRFRVFEGHRVRIEATHGTGCVLSSAIAANLALGYGLEGAVERAIRYVRKAIRRGFSPGGGAAVPSHPQPQK